MKTMTMKQPVMVGMNPIGIVRVAENILNTLRTWRERAQQRRQLLTLDYRMLQDIGISRAEAIYESNKRVWEK